MSKSLYREYENLTLSEVAGQLHVNYYSILRELVRNADEMLRAIEKIDIDQITRGYTGVCEQLLRNISSFLKERSESLTPYLADLQHKNAEGHDCGSCSGLCEMGHTSHVAMLKTSHD